MDCQEFQLHEAAAAGREEKDDGTQSRARDINSVVPLAPLYVARIQVAANRFLLADACSTSFPSLFLFIIFAMIKVDYVAPRHIFDSPVAAAINRSIFRSRSVFSFSFFNLISGGGAADDLMLCESRLATSVLSRVIFKKWKMEPPK